MINQIIHLWYSPVLDEALVRPLLSLAERDELTTHPEQRKQQATAWAMRRSLLTTLMDREIPTLMRDDRGRPYLDQGPTFSTAHTHDMVVVAAGSIQRLGIDVEHLERRSQAKAIAQRFFPQEEQEWLANQADTAQAFIRHWVLKEAMTKAVGLGLAGQLDRFVLTDLNVHQAPEAWGGAAPWQVERLSLPGNFCVGVVGTAPYHIKGHRWTP